MKKLAISSVVAAVLAAAGAVQAQQYQNYMPLKEGNQWTYFKANPVAKFAPWTVSVDQKYSTIYHLDAFPGFPDGGWFAWSGNTLYAWSWELYDWVSFLRFGASVGTSYTVTIDGPMWNGATVSVKSKTLKIENPRLNVTHTYVVHFTFQHPSLADAGVQEYMFDSGYGLVYWSEQSFAGPTTGWLGAGIVNGKKLGPVTYELLGAGSMTQYPVQGTNQVKLVNSAYAWKTMWEKHAPGTQAPAVDFTKHTVVAIFAGQRNTGGYQILLSSALWNFPSNASVRLQVTEITPAGPVILILTQPFAFYVLDAKVYSAQYDWNVVLNK